MMELIFGIFIGSAIGIVIAALMAAATRADLERHYLQEIYKLSQDKKMGKK